MDAFETAMLSRQGGRESNQDQAKHHVIGVSGCWVVADGLGGHQGGEVASELAATKILETFKGRSSCEPKTLHEGLRNAHQAILQRQGQEPRLGDMRTTATTLVSGPGGVLWGHVGDSRLYWFRRGRKIFQTTDHSLHQVLRRAGQLRGRPIDHREGRHQLTRSLGQTDGSQPEVVDTVQPVAAGDVFLLCSDGFWEAVGPSEMEIDLAKSRSPRDWLERLEERLIAHRGDRGDNYTALAVFCHQALGKVGTVPVPRETPPPPTRGEALPAHWKDRIRQGMVPWPAMAGAVGLVILSVVGIALAKPVIEYLPKRAGGIFGWTSQDNVAAATVENHGSGTAGSRPGDNESAATSARRHREASGNDLETDSEDDTVVEDTSEAAKPERWNRGDRRDRRDRNRRSSTGEDTRENDNDRRRHQPARIPETPKRAGPTEDTDSARTVDPATEDGGSGPEDTKDGETKDETSPVDGSTEPPEAGTTDDEGTQDAVDTEGSTSTESEEGEPTQETDEASIDGDAAPVDETEHPQPTQHSIDGQMYVWIDLGPVNGGFWIGQTEVTGGAYERFAQTFPAHALTSQPPGPIYPVTGVKWLAASTFCSWVGGSLPTLEQWRDAATDEPGPFLYPWGPDEPVCADNRNNGAVYRGCPGTERGPAPAQSYVMTRNHRLHHIVGNVAEWGAAPQKDRKAPIFGGSWRSSPSALKLDAVNQRKKDNPADTVGFRCVLTGAPKSSNEAPASSSSEGTLR